MKIIDAQNKNLGRIASQAASILLGKDRVDFEKNKIIGDKVHITNASKMNLTAKKLEGKTYKRFSGYPSGQRTESMKMLIQRKGYKEILKHAVKGMLPSNKLRDRMLKNLQITE